MKLNTEDERTEKTPFEDLKTMLLHSYKRNSKLSKNQIFASIGRLMKSLGFMAGTEKEILYRLKFEHYEHRKKATPGIIPEDVLWYIYSSTP